MTTPSRSLRVLAALLAAAAVALPGAPVALANGLGDLYVGAPEGVVEVRLVDEKIEATVDTGPATGLAFTNDGSKLYVIDEAGALTRIDIETIDIDKTYTLDAPAVAIAHPKGVELIVAYEDSHTVGVLSDGEAVVEEGPELSGKPDLLAADRLEHRVVAARYGDAWVDVVETPSGQVINATVDGEVVALAVADDTGYAYVATTGPNTLLRLSLDTGKVDWEAELPGKPAAVTGIPGAAVVAVGKELFKVNDTNVTSWAKPAESDITGLASSDAADADRALRGEFVFAATAEHVIAIETAKPTTEPRATVDIAEVAALAPVHKVSTLSANGGMTTNPEDGTGGKGDDNGKDGDGPKSTKAPATDAEGDTGPRWHRPGPDPVVLFGGMAGIVLLVLVGSHQLMKRTL